MNPLRHTYGNTYTIHKQNDVHTKNLHVATKCRYFHNLIEFSFQTSKHPEIFTTHIKSISFCSRNSLSSSQKKTREINHKMNVIKILQSTIIIKLIAESQLETTSNYNQSRINSGDLDWLYGPLLRIFFRLISLSS